MTPPPRLRPLVLLLTLAACGTSAARTATRTATRTAPRAATPATRPMQLVLLVLLVLLAGESNMAGRGVVEAEDQVTARTVHRSNNGHDGNGSSR